MYFRTLFIRHSSQRSAGNRCRVHFLFVGHEIDWRVYSEYQGEKTCLSVGCFRRDSAHPNTSHPLQVANCDHLAAAKKSLCRPPPTTCRYCFAKVPLRPSVTPAI